MRRAGDSWQISDIYLDGTISMARSAKWRVVPRRVRRDPERRHRGLIRALNR
jgi:hypothetical protein